MAAALVQEIKNINATLEKISMSLSRISMGIGK